jgi:hypothetical protein
MDIYRSLFSINDFSGDLSYDYDIGRPLLEATFNIDNDVDLLYHKSGFDSIVLSANKYLLQKNINDDLKQKLMTGKDITFYETDTSILKEDDSKKAHAINPVPIFLGIYQKGSAFDVKNNIIYTSLDYNSLNILIQYGMFGREYIKSILSKSDYQFLLYDLKVGRVKAIIAHELSHWISDALFNRHLKKIVDLAIKLNDKDVLKLKQKDVNMTYFEIDAQIHGIKNLKKQRVSVWDEIDLTRIFFMYPSLRAITVKLYKECGQEVLNIWLKNLIKRMGRKGLLGKNMKKFPDIKELTEQNFSV